VTLDRAAHHIGLVRHAAGIEPGARPHPILRPATMQRKRDGRGDGGVADAHLADAQQIRPLGHRLHAIDHDGGAVGLLHRRIAGDVAGRLLERQFIDLEPDAEGLTQLVDRRPAGLEVRHHLGRYRLRERRDVLTDDAVVAGEHHRQRPLDGGRMAALPGGEPFRDLLQTAERARRLGQLGLTCARRGARLEIRRRHLGQHGADGREGGRRAFVHVRISYG
jgi:hypothetical protein